MKTQEERLGPAGPYHWAPCPNVKRTLPFTAALSRPEGASRSMFCRMMNAPCRCVASSRRRTGIQNAALHAGHEAGRGLTGAHPALGMDPFEDGARTWLSSEFKADQRRRQPRIPRNRVAFCVAACVRSVIILSRATRCRCRGSAAGRSPDRSCAPQAAARRASGG